MKSLTQSLFIKRNVSRLTGILMFLCVYTSMAQCPVIGPDSVYDAKDDILITSYHQSIAKTPTGLITWGEDMDATGGNAPTIREISPANGYSFTGTVLQYAVSGNSGGQAFLATTDDLYAWGGVGEVLIAPFVSGNAFAPMLRPPGVAGSDILDLFATSNVLVLVTNSGNVWVASNQSRISGNASTVITIWQQVQTSLGVPLTDVYHVTGSDVALYALQNDGDIFVWGDSVYLGNGLGVANYNYATQMVAPPSAPTYISAFHNDNITQHGVLALGADKKIYGVGHNTSEQIINSTTGAVLNWIPIVDSLGSDLENVLQLSTNHTSEQYASAAVITQGATPADKRVLLTWGSDSYGNIGHGDLGTVQFPSVPGGYTVGSDDAVYVSVGGHATTIFNKNTQTICFTGHVTSGSTGGLTGSSATSFVCITVVDFDVCGVNTCLVDSIASSNESICNDNGTAGNAADDTFTADITVTFLEIPATGTLDLTGDGSASVAIGALGSSTSHTFVGVTLPANGSAVSLTATFSDEVTCTFTNANVTTAPTSCSATILAQNDNFSGTIIGDLVGGTTVSVFANNGNGVDDANGSSASDANIDNNISITNDDGLTGVSINSDGTINVPAVTTVGTYNIVYQICLTINNTVCSSATATVVVGTCLDFPNNDCDGDGVTNGDELSPPDGETPTDPNDSCDYVLADISLTQTGAYLLADCDGDGVTNGDELSPPDGETPTDPNDPCDYILADITLTQTGAYLLADCDGDGVTNGDELSPPDGETPTDPNDPCDYVLADISLTQTGAYLLADCDGDGVTNGDELSPPDGETPTDPNDPCDYVLADISLTQTGAYLLADCDGDGVTNGDELSPPDGEIPTDPNDPCDYVLADISLTQTGAYLLADCDGDGVTNGDELSPPDGETPTDPNDPCDYVLADITLTQTGAYLLADCDGDGVTNGDELSPPDGETPTDPNDPCSFVLADISTPDLAWNAADCDGDGVTNGDELSPPDGETPTNPNDPCDYILADITLTQTGAYLLADCDGDGVTNGDELSPPDGEIPTDPNDPCDYILADITLTQTGAYLLADCDGDGVTNGDELSPPDGEISTDPNDPVIMY